MTILLMLNKILTILKDKRNVKSPKKLNLTMSSMSWLETQISCQHNAERKRNKRIQEKR
jgi:hypothetical protein